MNTTQINYFLEAARCLNFTEAAKRLYISQPALSKQITAIEKELNMMLFVRNKKSVRLTPAGVVLLRELPNFQEQYAEIIYRAKIANEGNMGEITIGILEGQMLGARLTKIFSDFTEHYPNISVRLQRESFSGLRRKLNAGEIDLAFSLDFDISGNEGIECMVLEECPALLAISQECPIKPESITTWGDLDGVSVVAVAEEDCPLSGRMILEDCRRTGAHPDIRFAKSLETAMLWIEAGVGVGFVNSMNNLCFNPAVTLRKLPDMKPTYSVIAWSVENINPTMAMLRNFVESNMCL